MKILFEEYLYKTDLISSVIGERYFFPVNSLHSKINFVGYYYNPNADNGKGDIVIILPKVFINEKLQAFEEFDPEELINPNSQIQEKLRISGKDKVIFEISTWLYRAIQQYNKRLPNNTISENQQINQVVSNLDDTLISELDIILSLLKFYKENQNLFTFISKTSNSQLHKINWQKTINKQQPIIQNNQPFYIDVNSKNKKVNNEEELLILFYSTLNYIKNKYAFDLQLPQNYDLFRGNQFESILRRGTKYLKSIKYKYFSDKMINLYNVLYTFFERSEKIQSKKQLEEILLIRDFNKVFEDMIDDLIGDKNLLSDLKNHPDGKQLDHIYKYKSLMLDDSIYYIGDSKYYKIENKIEGKSIAKQFTYAKNVIQREINLFNQRQLEKDLKYRDNDTEGYNLTPNFFISAFIDKSFDFKKSGIKENSKPQTEIQYHWVNRLFDRDTLFLQTYNINFLFVLSAYISKNSTLKESFKKETHKHFRTKLIEYINNKYIFHKAIPLLSSSTDELIIKHFKYINGKVYKPSQMSSELIFAFEKTSDYTSIITSLKPDTSSFEEYVIN